MALKFSIITCTLNSEKFLRQCVDSVLSQDYPYVEHIFVDGNSEDGTLDIIRSIQRPIKLATGSANGISAAMNEGIKLATGNVIAHLHSDDYFLNGEVLSTVAHSLDTSRRQWLFGRVMTDKDGILYPEGYRIPEFSYRTLLKRNFIPHPAVFIRKELLVQVGQFSEKLKYAMDYDMWLRLGRIAEPLQLNKHLAAFRCHTGSLSTREEMKAFIEDHEVRGRYVQGDRFTSMYHFAHYVVRWIKMYRKTACNRGLGLERHN
jgi:GT2 family glycosyltransferase